MKSRSTLVYLLILAVVAGATFYLQKNVKSTDDQNKVSNKLFQFKQDDATGLEITSAGNTVVLEKKNNKWSITKPVATPADESAVSGVLSELEFTQSERVIQPSEFPKDTDPKKQFGLDPATCQVKVITPTGPLTIWLGRKTAFGDNYYARTSDSTTAPVYILKAFAKTALDKSLSDLRSRTVLEIVTTDINQVGLRRTSTDGHSTIEHLATRTGETWILEKPLNARVDKLKVNSLLANVVSLRAEDFVSDDSSNLTAYGLATPQAQFTIRAGKDNKETTLLVGAPDPKKPTNVYVKTLQGNTVFTLTKASVDQIINSLPEVRDRKLLVFDSAKVTKIVSEIKGRTLQAELKDQKWTITPGGFPGDADQINALLGKLSNLQAATFVKESVPDLKPYGLDKPQARLTLTVTEKDKSTPVELIFGKADKTQIFAKNNTEAFIAGLAPSAMDELAREPLALRQAQVLDLDVAKVKKITLTDAAGKTVTFTRKADNSFETDQAGRQVDNFNLTSLLNLVCKLRAAKWIGDAQPVHGLAKPTVTLTLSTPEETVIRVGAVLSNGARAGQVSTDNTVFEISAADTETLAKVPLMPLPTPTAAPSPAPAAK